MYFYIATLNELNDTLHRFTNYRYPRVQTSNPSAATIPGQFPWAMSLLLGDVHHSELETLDKHCLTVEREIMTIRSPVNHLIAI